MPLNVWHRLSACAFVLLQKYFFTSVRKVFVSLYPYETERKDPPSHEMNRREDSMKPYVSFAIALMLASVAFGQRIVVVDNDAPEQNYLRSGAIRATLMLEEGRQVYREAPLNDVFFDGQRFR